ncbi:PfkB family carbohydrate kinase [Deinococcus koreensis]|uniref:Ribokinase n=1 Tax=Deinococcus koreensis TaxID=2054903 RepID=A0A2K3URX6_9DEIO|nr:PfkB family carbohydrate kinase [Deinococcus koreensis]PNY79302.1 ribokinase [Deinococcus koreensis]
MSKSPDISVVFAGSLHIDQMIQLDELPSPGETVIAGASWTQLGGKATNQAVAAAPHVRAVLLACVGNDEGGRDALATLNSLGVHPALQVDAQVATGSSVALIDAAGENVGVVLPGANTGLRAEPLSDLLKASPVQLVVCQWETEPDTLGQMLSAARATGVPILLNAAPWLDSHRGTLPLTDHVVVNAVEAQAWTGHDPQERVRQLDFGHPSVVVTLGAGGVLHYQKGALTTDLPAPVVQARSTHGAGDHFVGVLAAHLARGTPMPHALERAGQSAAEFVQLLHKHLALSST